MLTNVSGASSPKQIAVQGTTKVLYVVPGGKTFTGHLFGGGNASAEINGVSFSLSGQVIPVTFPSGTVVGSNSTYGCSLIGVEQ